MFSIFLIGQRFSNYQFGANKNQKSKRNDDAQSVDRYGVITDHAQSSLTTCWRRRVDLNCWESFVITSEFTFTQPIELKSGAIKRAFFPLVLCVIDGVTISRSWSAADRFHKYIVLLAHIVLHVYERMYIPHLWHYSLPCLLAYMCPGGMINPWLCWCRPKLLAKIRGSHFCTRSLNKICAKKSWLMMGLKCHINRKMHQHCLFVNLEPGSRQQ